MPPKKVKPTDIESSSRIERSIGQIIQKATSVAPETGIYANHIQMSITNNEIFLDFYSLSPSIHSISDIKATHLQRVFIPHSLGKGFATALANIIDTFESDNHIEIPLNRNPEGQERIVIWPPKQP